MPGETAVATPVLTDGKRSVVLKKTQSPTLRDISNLYVDAAVKDMLFTIPATEDTPEATAVMGVPFSLDTLGLFSNMDLLTSAGIKEPPKTWQEFELAVTKLTARRGDVVALAGAAMGTSRNVPHATEILGTLMQQNGTTMTDARGFAQFQERERSTGGFPAIDALLFYQNFANPAAGTYTWNANMPNGFDAFVTGSAAMYFGYPTDAVVARERNGKLRFVITGMPQVNLGRSLSTALYPIEVVSKKSVHQQEAWDFLLFAASGEQVSSYLSSASRPPALRALIPAAAGNPEVAGFANQVLTATSWYRGNDYSEVEAAFEEMMESDVEARDLGDLMEAAVRRINVTIQ
jgi:multiple sugar transport system substrate-binding protein